MSGHGWSDSDGTTKVLWEKPVFVPLCAPQISHELAWYWTWAFAVGDHWLTTYVVGCSQAVSKPVWHIPLLCVQWKTPDDGQRSCLKHVEFNSKNKFEKLVHLVGFIIRNYHNARSPEHQIFTVVIHLLCHEAENGRHPCEIETTLCWKIHAWSTEYFANSSLIIWYCTWSETDWNLFLLENLCFTGVKPLSAGSSYKYFLKKCPFVCGEGLSETWVNEDPLYCFGYRICGG